MVPGPGRVPGPVNASARTLNLTGQTTDTSIRRLYWEVCGPGFDPRPIYQIRRPLAKGTSCAFEGVHSRLSPSTCQERALNEADVLASAQKVAGHQFNNLDLLLTSLTHASVADSRLVSNERLEFLGDAVLGMIVCQELYDRYEDWLEGDLTKVKSVIVSRRLCAQVADEIGLTKLLILGNGIDAESDLPTSVKAAVFEAVIGAIFVDGGLEAARRFILAPIARHIVECASSDTHDNYKSILQQHAQRFLCTTPQYEVLDEQGPDHSKCFEVCVVISGRRYPSAWGPSKKLAEQEAARRALEKLEALDENDPD